MASRLEYDRVTDGPREPADPPPAPGRPDEQRGVDGGGGGHLAPSDGSADGSDSGGERREPPELVRKLQARRESYREHGLVYRVAWVTAALIVIAAGIAMIVFPGPALVVIPIGLAMLSLEFAWAQRLLDTTLERGVEAKDIAMGASRRQKIVGVAALACAIAAVAAVALIILL